MKLQAIFTKETSKNQLLGKKGIFIVSLNLHEEQPDNSEKNDKFLAGIERLQTSASSLDFISTEVLNRYNFEIIFNDPIEAKQKSIENFNFWKAKNFEHVKNLKNLNQCLSWGELLNHSDYVFCLGFVKKLYVTDIEFKRLVCKTASLRLDFLMTDLTKSKLTLDFSPEAALKKSINYIIEECAMIIFFRLHNYDSLFYLGKISLPIEYISTLKDDQLHAKSANLLNIFSINQYKVIHNSSSNHINNNLSPFKDKKLKSDMQSGQKDHIELAYKVFFNSPNIPTNDKIEALLKITFFQKNIPSTRILNVHEADIPTDESSIENNPLP